MHLLDQFKQISTFFFDVDGVLTDGTVLLVGSGTQARRMSIKDGLALQLAARHCRLVLISGADATPVADRFVYLGLNDVYLGVKNKAELLQAFCHNNDIALHNVLFMGDDLPDLPALRLAGLASCPADAVPEVRAACHYISPKNGGAGCVRDVIEKVLKLQGHWQTQTDLISQ